MSTQITDGNYAHVAGTFNLDTRKGTIDFVTPVAAATLVPGGVDEGIHLVGDGAEGAVLFDQVVRPQRNSCAPHAHFGTFEEFVPVSPQLRSIRLLMNKEPVAKFTRGQAPQLGVMSFGAAPPDATHKLPLAMAAAPPAASGISYTVLARGDGAGPWQTLALGLKSPNAHVDVNQFPGARTVEVRVMQSDGFAQTEVFRDTKQF